MNDIVYVQWLDKQMVSMLSTMHCTTVPVEVPMWVKVNGFYQQQSFCEPAVIKSCNQHMAGVGELAFTYPLLHRSKNFTEVFSCDLLEIVTNNAFKLQMAYTDANLGAAQLSHSYSQYELRENLL